MAKQRLRPCDEVSAKELAEMGFCEMRVLLEHLHGEHVTLEQRVARTRGQVAHQSYYEQGMASSSDRRCFVATFVFGPDASETQVLRAYRDEVLLRRCWGRWAVATYYWSAPAVSRVLERSPATAAGLRRLLRVAVSWCQRTLNRRRRG
ncbi:CFI-box-CTERM domain-containing protein [Xenophilus azovorans]|uniref:CFI-box-CTERM domain-containing protein n=1 Tax=Xenophilus azovorans TaxID=151755 RepID=UPI00056EEC72|nr:CFI-box-CTERM domain-containing protein [Xenophilus azovorans]